MTYEGHKKMLLRNPEFRKALKEAEPEYQIARQLILARIKKGMTQQAIARKMKTKQSVISRVENAQTTPTVSFLSRLAQALGTHLTISFGS
ncbi:MAG: helix-turn-helix domain-containing protein [Patescibacteria group bacterium]|nr:helix-turn-helix domain-containing protein [Patescibacteria group bacterium]MCL5431967.1 helix-turn-helix domain-containing protein [Patescibacteria group bacterium]